MSEQKLLTLCIPTYNRGIHLEEQLKRLSSIPLCLWNYISVFISDNCSTDNTEAIVKKYLNLSQVDITYSRNETNMGMDGNFVKCFKSATSKYVWLLGDDDYIKVEELPLIINTIRGEKYGLCHLGMKGRKTEQLTIYTDKDAFLKEIDIWITYISSNIVKTKYVKEIDFDKYMGSFFTLVPLYITALSKAQTNVMINVKVFEDGKDLKRNGGYSIAQVFVKNLLNIFKEYEEKGVISKDTYEHEKDAAFDFVIPLIVSFVVFNKKSYYRKNDTWKIMIEYYGIKKTLCGILNHIFIRFKNKIIRLLNLIIR